MSNRFNIFAGIHSQEPLWLESRATLASARERVDHLSAVSPGPYFVFSAATGQVVYQTRAPKLVDLRFEEMKAARQEWECAALELTEALELFRDLMDTPASPDGDLALRNARMRELWALKKYRAAVHSYAAAETTTRMLPVRH